MLNATFTIFQGNALEMLRGMKSESVQCCVTSPPYWGLRDYGVDGQLGLEKTPEAYVAAMVEVFREVKRVLRSDGTCWLNLGDSYATGAGSGRSMGGDCFGKQNQVIDSNSYPQCQPNRMRLEGLKPKDLVGIPWMVAFALRSDGWWLRSDIIWAKPNPMPESVTDRPTKSHEYIFLLTKSSSYFYDIDAIREPHLESSIERARHPWLGESVRSHPSGNGQLVSAGRREGAAMDTCHPNGRNKRTIWTITTESFSDAHFATFPKQLVETCIKAGTKHGDMVLDPFCGSGTTGVVALRMGRNFVGIELNAGYVEMARRRIMGDAPLLNRESTQDEMALDHDR